MEEVARILLDEGAVAYLQSLAYTADGLRVLNCQVVQSGGLSDDLLDRYNHACFSFQAALEEIIKEAAPQYIGPEYRHEVHYLTGELLVRKVVRG